MLGKHRLFEGVRLNLGYDYYVTKEGYCSALVKWMRIYGSHSEAKKQLPKWLHDWPDARIVPIDRLMTS